MISALTGSECRRKGGRVDHSVSRRASPNETRTEHKGARDGWFRAAWPQNSIRLAHKIAAMPPSIVFRSCLGWRMTHVAAPEF